MPDHVAATAENEGEGEVKTVSSQSKKVENAAPKK
jgi:hypothetical protein